MSTSRAVCSKPGTSSNPSTALRILMAGVIMPSPISNEMPINDSSVTNAA